MTKVGFGGHAPAVLIEPIAGNPERDKYRAMWLRDEYRQVAPGEHAAMTFIQQARLPANADVIDFGCGTGRGALMIALMGGARVTMLDFADNCLDPEVRQATTTQGDRLKFELADLTRPIPHHAAYGYCTDVLEHIPPADVQKVLRHILAAAEHVFFSISCVEDKLGALIGEPLHLTVKPAAWWLQQLTDLGAVVHWHASSDEGCMVYCSSWGDANALEFLGRINAGEAVVDAQARINIEAGWQHVQPHDKQERELIVLAGGPSMREPDQLREIIALRAAGAALVTINGSYDWAIERGLEPSAQIVLDGREFNARFTRTPHPTCRYLIASQVHPSVLDGLPRDRTFLWHSGVSDENEALIRERTGQFFPVPGGSTVVLRAIPLLRMLGFARMHFFGFDSSVRADGSHHAYEQPENDGQPLVPVTCGGRVYLCAPWMLAQATEFIGIVKFMGDLVELSVHGDGLIAGIIRTGAQLAAIAAPQEGE